MSQTSEKQETSTGRKSRSSWGGRVLAIAMLVGGAGTAFALQTPGNLGLPMVSSVSQELKSNAVKNVQAEPTKVLSAETVAFTTAKAGDCLTWNLDSNQTAQDFKSVNCAVPHNYEVSGKMKLTDYESYQGEFDKNANYPTADQLTNLADTLCQDSLSTYLGGKLDLNGRIHPTPILPSQSQWKEGDRTVLCGGMATNVFGQNEPLTGKIAEIDQARVFEPRVCARMDENGGLVGVDCNEDHALESTAIVNLKEQFADTAPTDQQQNDLLADRCVKAAQDYLGGDDPLYNSTLVPFWTALTPEAYAAGSHSVNCWLMKDNGAGGFSTLKGHANESFTIDGAPPVAPPPRNPLRSDVGVTSAPAAPAAPVTPETAAVDPTQTSDGTTDTTTGDTGTTSDYSDNSGTTY